MRRLRDVVNLQCWQAIYYLKTTSTDPAFNAGLQHGVRVSKGFNFPIGRPSKVEFARMTRSIFAHL